MPITPDINTLEYKGRSHTSLVVSEGNAPAEEYIPAAAETVKFKYQFGPEGNKGVVIPKGKIVTFAGYEYDPTTEHRKPAIKIAGTTDLPMGVNHHNVYERIRDRFSGNAPTVITREFIRVPLFAHNTGSTAIDMAAAIKFGAMSVAAAGSGTTQYVNAANAIYGKYVKADANGNFVVADPATDSYSKIVGQVYGVECEIPPAGFLQYFMDWSENEYTEFLKATQNIPSAGRTTNKLGTLDIATFPAAAGYWKDSKEYAEVLKNFRAGIPFLTDGYFKARTQATITLADHVAAGAISAIKATSNVTIAANQVTVADPQGAMLFIKLRDELAKDALPLDTWDNLGQADVNNYPEFANGPTPGGIAITVGGAAVSKANYHVDYENNVIVLYFTAPVANAAVSITATVLQNKIPGIPTGWDFKGTVGEARILLMK